MNEREIELMKRYSYEVGRRVPKHQSKDIQMELENLIEDMYEAAGPKPDMEKLLKSLGNPADFAKQYRDEKKVLISSEYFDDYSWLVKLVLGCVLLGIGISFVVQIIVNPQDILYHIGEGITGLMVGAMSAFGAVTLLFAILERQKIKVEFREAWYAHQPQKGTGDQKEKEWEPKRMPSIPSQKSLISRGDCIVSIVFIVLFCILVIVFPSFAGMRIQLRSGGDFALISIFNMDYWHVILPLFLMSMGTGLASEIQKLITGRHCKAVMLSSVGTGVVQIVIAVILLKGIPFFNPNFMKEMESQLSTAFNVKNEFLILWNTELLSNLVLIIIVAATLCEVGTIVYKTLRYGTEPKTIC